MTAVEWIGFALALAVMILGLVGCVLPGVPGTPLVLAAAIGHRLYFGANSVSNAVLAILVLLTLFALGLDYLATLFGARKMGASWRGLLGALVGGVVGLFFSLPGLLLGPFIGALTFELVGGRDFSEATRAGVGTIIGLVIGAAGKVACCIAMTALFAVNVMSRSGAALETVASLTNR
jgi:uncharacterized protein YqgC (DUF456 family)